MAIAGTQDVKDYFRIETTAEDTLIATLVARAKAEIEGLVGKPLTEEDIDWRDDMMTHRLGETPTSIILKYTPIKTSDLVVRDVDGNVVPVADYRIRQDLGLIQGLDGVLFPSGPYRITGKGGLQHATQAARVEHMINATIIDLVGFYLQQRTPGASSENAANTGTSFVYGIDYGGMDAQTGLPKRVMKGIRKLRAIVS